MITHEDETLNSYIGKRVIIQFKSKDSYTGFVAKVVVGRRTYGYALSITPKIIIHLNDVVSEIVFRKNHVAFIEEI